MREEDRKMVIRSCPICKKQALHVVVDRHGTILSAECILCGNKKEVA